MENCGQNSQNFDKETGNLFLIDLSFLVRVSGCVAGIFLDIHYSCIANIRDIWLQERLMPSFLLAMTGVSYALHF